MSPFRNRKAQSTPGGRRVRSHILGRIELDQECLREDLEYLASVPTVEEEYDELSNGFWKNIPLHHASGGSDDRLYRDLHGAPAQPTEHVEHVPYLNEIITTVSNVERLQMARTRNPKNAVVIPHHDLVEIDRELDQHFRTRLMLKDSPPAFHSDDDTVIHMRAGEIWFLDPAAVRSAVNFAEFSRQSLCADLAFEGAFDEKEAFADATVHTPVEKAERIRDFAIGARELGERFSLTTWYAAGERGPGEQ
ncbi:aspartyl/asparaginyl beta-hydroxylase domain-containing protein [Streptomyces sp. NPDC051644]|uniref:aspartyl/asparaginyl beta-hydroxylase domain-containing protein n=1 Tax=Streptomyces sp. NPDC051644 TaxID=3365666 RepID=UPI003788D05E